MFDRWHFGENWPDDPLRCFAERTVLLERYAELAEDVDNVSEPPVCLHIGYYYRPIFLADVLEVVQPAAIILELLLLARSLLPYIFPRLIQAPDPSGVQSDQVSLPIFWKRLEKIDISERFRVGWRNSTILVMRGALTRKAERGI